MKAGIMGASGILGIALHFETVKVISGYLENA
jgi:hypothetical protein